MFGLDPATTRMHRRQQAALGFPLLRGSPCTAAIGLINFLDRLSPDEHVSFADQMSDLVEAQNAEPAMTVEARAAIVRSLPLVERHFGGHFGLPHAPPTSIDVRTLPVKLLAGVMKDKQIGGFEGWLNLVRISDEPGARLPPAAHAVSLDEINPVAPARLRRLIGDSMKKRFDASAKRVASDHTKFTAQLPTGHLECDFIFATGGNSRQQFNYCISAKFREQPRLHMASYEGIWRVPSSWDYVTESNADRSIAHLLHQIATCLELI